MNIAEFWAIVDKARKASRGDQEAMLDALRDELGAIDPKEIASYRQHFDELLVRAYRWDLWGAAYIMNGGCSDDGFEYFRYWLIAMGRDVYEAALKSPDSLASVKVTLAEDDMIEFESFAYVPDEVYEELEGEEMPRADVKRPTEPVGTQWAEDGDDLERLCPKLWKKYFGE